jgi:simple sugar transport system substrate-binding protein/ribose transport system substrate-binding protein
MLVHKGRLARLGCALAVVGAGLGLSLPGATSAQTAKGAAGQTPIGIALTYNNTAFWAAYINYEKQYAQQMHIKLLGPLLAGTNASLQNTQVDDLVNEGAKAVIVNPETATSMGPAISYAAKHGVKLISVDTIVGVGKVGMVVRASNIDYGEDACLYISHYVKSGYVIDIEGDLTSSNGADRTDAFNQCMKANDPKVKVLAEPTVWVEATAAKDIATELDAYGSQVKAIYNQYSGPDPAAIADIAKHHLTGKTILIGDDGVPYEMCDIQRGDLSAASSQPANLYAQGALTYALDSAKSKALKPGQSAIGAPALANVSYKGDTNLGDPIVAPFVTKTKLTLHGKGVLGAPGTLVTTPVSDASLWGNVYGKAHGGVCAGVPKA